MGNKWGIVGVSLCNRVLSGIKNLGLKYTIRPVYGIMLWYWYKCVVFVQH